MVYDKFGTVIFIALIHCTNSLRYFITTRETSIDDNNVFARQSTIA